MNRKILCVIFVLSFSINSFAQFYLGSPFDEQKLQMRVKQLNQFFDRFNYERDIENKAITGNKNRLERQHYIANLFNKEMVMNAPDSVFQIYMQFIETATDSLNPVYLHFADTNWVAQADCKVMLKGKPAKITLFLKTKQIAGDRYKWFVSDVAGDILNLQPEKQGDDIMISPVDNELNFMSLSSEMTNLHRKSIVNYMNDGYKVDKISVFNSLIYYDLLKIEYVEQLVYHFNQVRGFIFSVTHFERQSDNVGWLISNVLEK